MAQEMNLWTRISSETPKFFKRLALIAVSIAGSAMALLALPASVIVWSPLMVKILTGFVTAGAVAAAVSKLPMSDAGIANAKVDTVVKEAEVKIDVVADAAKDKISETVTDAQNK